MIPGLTRAAQEPLALYGVLKGNEVEILGEKNWAGNPIHLVTIINKSGIFSLIFSLFLMNEEGASVSYIYFFSFSSTTILGL